MDAYDPCAPRPGAEILRLDAVGLICPAPVLEARKALDRMQAGDQLDIRTDDPLAELDLQVFCDRTGHRLLSSREDGGVRTTRIQKVASGSSGSSGSTRKK
jgi:tRNA 2-thiouridine synthesizing protein A